MFFCIIFSVKPHEAFPHRLTWTPPVILTRLCPCRRVTRHGPAWVCVRELITQSAGPTALIPACCTMRAKASDMHSKDCVKVAVRVRPFNKVSQCKIIPFLFLQFFYLPDVFLMFLCVTVYCVLVYCILLYAMYTLMDQFKGKNGK